MRTHAKATRPLRLLDLFCGAGGASAGYTRAGFEVTGVDIRPQPRYRGHFIEYDALEFVDLHGHEYDAIHASPPCQAYTSLRSLWPDREYVDFIPEVRAKLCRTGKPWLIENVPGAPLLNPVILCGSMFGLNAGPAYLRRHRIFEVSWGLILTPDCRHRKNSRVIGVYGGHGRDRRRPRNTQDFSMEERRQAMGIDWMASNELSQAIPPAYTEWLGKHLHTYLMRI